MKGPLTFILNVAIIGYVLHSTWSVFSLFMPLECDDTDKCITPFLLYGHKYRLSLFTSTKKKVVSASRLNSLWNKDNFDVTKPFEVTLNVSIPQQTRKNGTLFIHAFLMPKFRQSESADHLLSSPFSYHLTSPLTTYRVPNNEKFNLLGDETKREESGTKKVVTHWRQKLTLSIVDEVIPIPIQGVPYEVYDLLRLTPDGEYLPIFYVDTLSSLMRDYKVLDQNSSKAELILSYNPTSLGKLRFMTHVESSMEQMEDYGFSRKDLDDMKMMFTDTNLVVLLFTFIAAAFHLLFDFLAFKNDISFWHRRRNMAGLSTRTLVWRCASHLIVFLYLLDEKTSMLVLVPAGIGSVIEIWKLKKAMKVTLVWQKSLPNLKFGVLSAEEEKTGEYDAEIMKYLSYLLYPLCLAGAVYSLLYTPQKGWYSWCIRSLVNGVYGFGFLFMLPQLFVNYKLKSVAHLPWRSFMYKAFNTFIDDVFAFVITMPTAHRFACFRDDIIFLIYLSQRWIYRVDKTRVNEFGASFEDEKNKEEKEEIKKSDEITKEDNEINKEDDLINKEEDEITKEDNEIMKKDDLINKEDDEIENEVEAKKEK